MRFVLAVSLLVALLFGSMELLHAQTRPIPLHEVKKDANGDGIPDLTGDTVTVAGIANIATGRLHEVYLQIFIQNDSTGLSIFSETMDMPIARGDSVVATGVVQQYFGLTEIEVIDYRTYKSTGSGPAPIPLAAAIDRPQPYEGMLVEGSGRVVGKGNRFNGKFLQVSPHDSSLKSIMVYVSNFHSQYADFDFESLSAGDYIQVSGILSQYDPGYPESSTYKISLRTPDDLQILGVTQSMLVWFGIGGIILSLAVVGWIISLRSRVKSKTRQIRKSLEEKELLLKEVHHRVKNNLAIISGLIELQLDQSINENTQKVLRDSQARIRSMALVHDKLYRTSTVTNIGMNTYIRELVNTLAETFTGPDLDVELRYEIESIELDIDRAIPCGLLINELVVNAFKHAFNHGEKGILEVSFIRDEADYVLSVADNGRGLPKNFEDKMESSLGMMLIDTFSRQLEATREIHNGEGARFTYRFPASPEDSSPGTS